MEAGCENLLSCLDPDPGELKRARGLREDQKETAV